MESAAFEDSTSKVLDVPSDWRRGASKKVESGIQTAELELFDYEVQVETEKRDVQTQFDAVSDVGGSLVVADEELVSFLRRVVPDLEVQLDRNSRSHAFDGYEVSWDEAVDRVTCMYTLTPDLPVQPTPEDIHEKDDLFDDKASLSRIHCTGVSWNANGSLLACSYGSFQHQGWCSHKGALCAWNVRKAKISATKSDVLVETQSCLMCVAFHPEQPSIVAGGTFNGNVIVWDLSNRDDPKTWRSPTEEWSHKDFVASVEWTYDVKDGYRLVSLGNDGKILIWHLKNNLEKPVAGCKLSPTGVKLEGRGAAPPLVGGTAMSFVPTDQRTFVVGTETGAVLKCSSFKAGDNIASDSLPNPVSFTFESHIGPVNRLRCSPFHRNIFATAGSDGVLRIYNLLQARPQIVIEPSVDSLLGVSWSAARATVLAAGASNGHVYIYDLKANKSKPVSELKVCDRGSVVGVEFNKTERGLLATCDSNGSVQIWQLNQLLTAPQAQEMSVLGSL